MQIVFLTQFSERSLSKPREIGPSHFDLISRTLPCEDARISAYTAILMVEDQCVNLLSYLCKILIEMRKHLLLFTKAKASASDVKAVAGRRSEHGCSMISAFVSSGKHAPKCLRHASASQCSARDRRRYRGVPGTPTRISPSQL